MRGGLVVWFWWWGGGRGDGEEWVDTYLGRRGRSLGRARRSTGGRGYLGGISVLCVGEVESRRLGAMMVRG